MGANGTLVESVYSAFGRGDIPGLLALLDDDVEWSSPKTLPQGGQFRGKSEVAHFFDLVGGAWDPLTVAVEGLGELRDDLVVVVVRADGTRRGGQGSGYGAVHVFDVQHGKIRRFREYSDLDTPLH
jgi:uncharacterized protein